MRNYLLPILFFLFTQSNAQQWLEPTAKWYYSHYWFRPLNNVVVSLGADTVIDNHFCQRIVPDKVYRQPIHFTYQSSDTIYFYLKGKFRPTIRLNALKGDTLHFFSEEIDTSSKCFRKDSLYLFRLDTIYNTSFDTFSLKTYRLIGLDRNVGESYPYSFTFTERIGFHDYIYPPFDCSTDPEGFTLCNYGDSTISGFWMNPNIQKCLSVGINETENIENNIKLYPNPVSDFLTIETAVKIESILLEDLQGKTILIPDINNNRVSLFQLNAGIYILKISTPEGIVRKRILKE